MAAATKSQISIGLAIMYIAWGTTWLGIAYTIETMPALIAMGFRFLTACSVLFAFLVIKNGTEILRITRPQLRTAAILGVFLLAAGLGTASTASKVVPIGVGSLVVASMPIWTTLFRFLDKDRPSKSTVIGLITGFIGISLIMLPGQTQARPGADGQSVLLWMLVISLGNISWAYTSFKSKKMDTPANAFVLSAYEMLFAGFTLIFVGLLMGESMDQLLNASARSLAGWVYLIIIGSLLGFSTYVWLLDHAPISLVSTYAYVNPIVAVSLGILILDEKLSANVIIGGAIVLAAVAQVIRIESKGVEPAERV
jgi:drug/metabolite transporter (DMT)-like permease